MLRDIARPFHSAGPNIRSNADQLSTAVRRLADPTRDNRYRWRRAASRHGQHRGRLRGRDGWEGLVRRADTGLYAAKEGRPRPGRGRPSA